MVFNWKCLTIVEHSPGVSDQILECCGQWHWRGTHSTAASLRALHHPKGTERICKTSLNGHTFHIDVYLHVATYLFFRLRMNMSPREQCFMCWHLSADLRQLSGFWKMERVHTHSTMYVRFHPLPFCDCHVIVMWPRRVVRLDRLPSMWLPSVNMLKSSKLFDSIMLIATRRTRYTRSSWTIGHSWAPVHVCTQNYTVYSCITNTHLTMSGSSRIIRQLWIFVRTLMMWKRPCSPTGSPQRYMYMCIL